MLGVAGLHPNPIVLPDSPCGRVFVCIQIALVSIKVQTKDMDVVCRRMLLLSRP